jgi:hypothetical protein
MDIKILLITLLFVQQIVAQKGSVYITPALGIQNGHSSILKDRFSSNATIKNNRIYVSIYYSIGIDYEVKNNHFISVNYFNGQAGVSIGLKNKPCSTNGNISSSRRSTATGFNNKRLNLGYQFPVYTKNYNKNVKLQVSFKAGVAIDFKGSESDSGGNIILPSINSCGEEYFLKKRVVYRKPLSLLMPFQVNMDLYSRQKRKVGLSIFYHKGITKNTQFDIDYITNSYTQTSSFLSRGTSYGVVLSYPIRVYKRKTR